MCVCVCCRSLDGDGFESLEILAMTPSTSYTHTALEKIDVVGFALRSGYCYVSTFWMANISTLCEFQIYYDSLKTATHHHLLFFLFPPWFFNRFITFLMIMLCYDDETNLGSKFSHFLPILQLEQGLPTFYTRDSLPGKFKVI